MWLGPGKVPMREIDASHIYFDELFEFSCMVVANMSVLMHAAATETIRNLVGCVNEMVKTKSVAVSGHINDHAMTSSIPMQSAGSSAIVTILRINEIFDYLTGAGKDKPSKLAYSVEASPTQGALPPASNDPARTAWNGADPAKRFEILTAYVIGGAFERRSSAIKAKYGHNPSAWPPAVQFFRHLRNGCFHSNAFNIRPHNGQPQIDPNHPPKWGSYTMASDSALNGRKAIGGFFHMHQTIPFLDDIGGLI
jgi:hypothetical protein